MMEDSLSWKWSINQKSHKCGKENNSYPTMSVMNPDQFSESLNASVGQRI